MQAAAGLPSRASCFDDAPVVAAARSSPLLPDPSAVGRAARRRSPRAHDARGEGRADDRASGSRRPTKLVDDDGNFDLAKARAAFGHGHGIGQVGRPSDAGGGRARNAARQAELTNAIQKFFIEESRLGIPVVFHEECLHGHAARRRDELSAADRPGRDVRSRARRALYAMTAPRRAVARHASGAHAGGGRRARSALGPRRGNVRRGPVSGRATGRRGGARLSGRRARSATRRTSSPRSSISPRTGSPSRARTARRRTSPSACCARRSC